jgi:peptidoglycan hydrolase-like protein with peptidoglycan-binding domain
MANYASKVIDIALAEEGYLEKKSNKDLDNKTKNAGSANYTKYGRDMHNIYPSVMDFPAAWCDCFVDWCFYKAFGKANAKALIGGNFNDYTPSSAQLYKNKNAYYKKDPKVGDQIFFKNSTRICHTGLVYKVDSKYVYTIEGNTSGASGVIANGGGVCKKKYELTYSKIDGYGRPKYDVKQESIVEKVVNAVSTKKKYNDTFPALPPRGYYKLGDGYNTLTNYKTQVKRVQKFMNWCMGGTLLKVDGEYGPKTEAKVISYQKKYKLTLDGKFGSECLKKAKTIKK